MATRDEINKATKLFQAELDRTAPALAEALRHCYDCDSGIPHDNPGGETDCLQANSGQWRNR